MEFGVHCIFHKQGWDDICNKCRIHQELADSHIWFTFKTNWENKLSKQISGRVRALVKPWQQHYTKKKINNELKIYVFRQACFMFRGSHTETGLY